MTDDEIYAENLARVIEGLGAPSLVGFAVVACHVQSDGTWALSNGACMRETRPGIALSMVAAMGALIADTVDTIGAILDPDVANFPVHPHDEPFNAN